jgi:nucleotide-binding universal stress UspA family protein
MILVCYDGSADARAAIDRAAELMPGTGATVLTIWEAFIDVMTRSGAMGGAMGMVGTFADDEKADEVCRQTALEYAAEGAARATAGGLIAESRIATRHGGIARVILATAGEIDAAVIVLGTRGLGGVKSFLLGSVSHAVVQHADRALLIVPSAELVSERRGWAAQTHAAVAAA